MHLWLRRLLLLLLLLLLQALVYVAAVSGGGDGGNTWVVQLDPGVTPEAFAARHSDLEYVAPFKPLRDQRYHVFRARYRRTRNHVVLARNLRARGSGAQWAERQAVRRAQHTRNMPPRTRIGNYTRSRYASRASGHAGDPLWPQQWHLHGSSPASVDVRGYSAHLRRTGRGITLAVVDDGLEHLHPEFSARFDAAHSWDYNGNKEDPSPTNAYDGHGTSAAGVAAAQRDNAHCGQGVAPEVRVVGIRAIAGPMYDYQEAQALSHFAEGTVDIYSCSWGPADDGTDLVGPGRVVRETLARYVGEGAGRQGKGTVYVWAGGNGRANQDSCAYDGYASNPYVNAIGAINHLGAQSWYSESCAALMAVTPSSGAYEGITTADLRGRAGYNDGECTSTFGGTSSAAPLAAGILALVLEERPEFTWRDVKHVIARGATRIRLTDPSWSRPNAAGLRHSNRFGFGLLKIPALLETARTHALVPTRRAHSSGKHAAPHTGAWPIPNNVGGERRIPLVMANTGITRFVEHVLVTVHVTHPRRGEVGITLRSPAGVVSVLAERRRDNHADYPPDGWTYTTVHHWGERTADGRWEVVFKDLVTGNRYSGRANWVKLEVYGY